MFTILKNKNEGLSRDVLAFAEQLVRTPGASGDVLGQVRVHLGVWSRR